MYKEVIAELKTVRQLIADLANAELHALINQGTAESRIKYIAFGESISKVIDPRISALEALENDGQPSSEEN